MKNLKFINKIKNKSGFSPIIAVIIVVIILIAGGYFLMTKSPAKKGQTKIEKSLDDLKVEAPELDLSLSPMPQLKVSSFNVLVPDLPAANMFSGFSIDTDFSYSPAVNISAPTVQFSMPSIQIPATQPSGGALEQQTQPQVDCSLFSAAPSCSYVGAPGSSAYEACKQCYPNK